MSYTTFQFQLARVTPTACGAACIAAFSSAGCDVPRAGGNRRLAKDQSLRAFLAEALDPFPDRVGIASQGLGDLDGRPASRRQPERVLASRSRGVGARYTCSRAWRTPNCQRSSATSISFIAEPHLSLLLPTVYHVGSAGLTLDSV